MNFATILVGDNGTPDAERAVAAAMLLGEKLKAKVILLGVLAPPSAESLAEGCRMLTRMQVAPTAPQATPQTAQAES
jgi:hypothetical protein